MAYSDVILAESSLVALWQLAETSGTTAVDSKGGFNGTYNGGYTLNQSGGGTLLGPSVLFNGSTSYVEVPTTAALHPTAALSIEAWVKLAALPGTSKTIAGCGANSNNIDYDLCVNSDNRLRFDVQVGGTLYQLFYSGTAAGVWYHLGCTFDGTTAKFYVNGVLADSHAVSGSVTNSSQPFDVGRYNRGTAGTGEYFSGNIEDVALYNAALPAAAVLSHYNAAGDPAARTTQVGVLTLSSGDPAVRTTQVGALALTTGDPAARVTRLGVLVLSTWGTTSPNALGAYGANMTNYAY